MIIRKGTYGSYERPCIWLVDEKYHQQEYIEYYYIKGEQAKEYLNDILARIEYCLKHNINVTVEGFRTDKEKYPNG